MPEQYDTKNKSMLFFRHRLVLEHFLFNDLLKKHGLPHSRFHELRHSCASMLIAMGWSLKDVQEWLGHSDVKMTANIYAHLDTARKTNIAESLAGRFGG